jgi:hypothetical protein
MEAVRWLAFALFWVFGCGGPAGAARGPSAGEAVSSAAGTDGFHFVVRPSEDARTLDVTVCFDGVPPSYLVCPEARAAAAVVAAAVRETALEAHEGEAMVREGPRLLVPRGLEAGACVGYVVDLERAIGMSYWNGMRRGDATLANAAAWLYRPAGLTDASRGTLRFELPDGMIAAVPFPRDGDHYVLDRTAFAYLGHTVIGRFQRFETSAAGATFEIARLDGALGVSDEELVAFVEHAAVMVSDIEGRFPLRHALVVIVPIGPGSSAVAFGNAGRAGGASVMLIVHENATAASLAEDWVPPHELTHLATPYVRRSDAWLSEGIATYYQEVLRARAGVRTPLEAWAAIDDGFSRGRIDGTGRTLEEESAHMFETAAFRRVYWAGTAIVLMADVELRKRGSSLDEALTALAECCAEPVRTWAAPELLAKLDELTGSSVFGTLAARHLGATDFPDLTETYAYLGVRRGEDGTISLDDRAEGASVRHVIMQGR